MPNASKRSVDWWLASRWWVDCDKHARPSDQHQSFRLACFIMSFWDTKRCASSIYQLIPFAISYAHSLYWFISCTLPVLFLHAVHARVIFTDFLLPLPSNWIHHQSIPNLLYIRFKRSTSRKPLPKSYTFQVWRTHILLCKFQGSISIVFFLYFLRRKPIFLMSIRVWISDVKNTS